MKQCQVCKCWYGDDVEDHVCSPNPMLKAADILDKEAIRIYKEDGKMGMSVVFATIAKALRGEE